MLPIGLIITFCRVCHQCEFCDGRRLEQRPNPEFDPERGVDSGNRPSRAERVSTQLEETVFCADGIGTENVDKSARDTNLCECGRHPEHRGGDELRNGKCCAIKLSGRSQG